MPRIKWTQEKDNLLKELYPHAESILVAESLGISLYSMQTRAKRLGLQKSSLHHQELVKQAVVRLQKSNQLYSCNHTYFSDIDTREKAYWLGWMWSDGFVRKQGEAYNIKLELHKKDSSIVEQFRNAIDANYPLHFDRNAVRINITSRQMFHDLGAYGIIPGKSLLATYPKIEKVFLADFVRGAFDGDGHISKTKSPQITVVGTEAFCLWLQTVAQENIGVKGVSVLKKNTTFRWTISGRVNLSSFARWIYQPFQSGERVICLERKYQRFVDAGLL